MTYSFVLLKHGFVCLTVRVAAFGGAAGVKEKFCLIEILFVTGDSVESDQSHFGYLVSRHKAFLPLSVTDIATHAVGIPDSYIKEIAFAGALIVSHGTFHHVTEVVELMREFFDPYPAFGTSPVMRIGRIHGA